MKKIIYSIRFIILAVVLISGCTGNEVSYDNDFYKLTLNRRTGSIKSIEKSGTNLIYTADSEGPLFTIRLRDASHKGAIHEFNALEAGDCRLDLNGEIIKLTFSRFDSIDLEVVVTIMVSKDSPMMRWNLSVENNSAFTIDHIDFPNVVVPNDLIATGGSGRIFWPAQEGCLIEDVRIREETWFQFKPIEYPKMGWGGLYPSSTQMQYMAYYNASGGLYLAAHDEQCNPKGIEFHENQ